MLQQVGDEDEAVLQGLAQRPELPRRPAADAGSGARLQVDLGDGDEDDGQDLLGLDAGDADAPGDGDALQMADADFDLDRELGLGAYSSGADASSADASSAGRGDVRGPDAATADAAVTVASSTGSRTPPPLPERRASHADENAPAIAAAASKWLGGLWSAASAAKNQARVAVNAVVTNEKVLETVSVAKRVAQTTAADLRSAALASVDRIMDAVDPEAETDDDGYPPDREQDDAAESSTDALDAAGAAHAGAKVLSSAAQLAVHRLGAH